MQHTGRGGRKTGRQLHGSGWGLSIYRVLGTVLHQHIGDRLGKRAPASLRRFLSYLQRIELAPELRTPLRALALVCGAATYFVLPEEPSILVSMLLLGGLALIGASFRWASNLPPLAGLTVSLALFSTSGLLAGELATRRAEAPRLAEAIGPVIVEGWITEVEPARRGVRVRLAVHAIDGMSQSAIPNQVRLAHIHSLEADVGRFVRCWSVLRPPPAPVLKQDYAFDRSAYFEGLGAVGYVQGRCRAGGLGTPATPRVRLELAVGQIRRAIGRHVSHHAGPVAGGFAAALTSGDRSFMKEDQREALRLSGLAHLMAISGLHMGLATGLVFAFVWRGLVLIEPLSVRVTVRKPAALAAILAGLAYLVLSGGSVSTQRAYIMILVAFGAILVDRRALSLQSVAIAMIIVTLLAPASVLTPGFQMSFAATAALVSVYEMWRRKRQAEGGEPSGIGFWFKSLVVTSVVSSVATMPFALYHFGRFAEWGVLANLFAMPIVTLVSAPLAIGSAIAAAFGVSELPLRLFGVSLEWILSIAAAFARAEPVSAGRALPMPGVSLACFSVALIIAMLGRARWRLVMAAPLIVGILTWIVGPRLLVHWAPSGDVVYRAETGVLERIRFVDGNGLLPMGFRDLPHIAHCVDAVCTYSTESGTLVLVPPEQRYDCGLTSIGDASLVLAASGATITGSCLDKVVHWKAVSLRHGVSWTNGTGRPQSLPGTSCGQRPWRPCGD